MQVEFIKSLLTHENFENMWFSDQRLDSRLPAVSVQSSQHYITVESFN